ncbi:uncharacterized protein LOC144549248 [Carex rostrata]
MGTSSSKISKMKSAVSAIDASVKDPIEPKKEVICDMETFTTVYCVKIKHYSEVKHKPQDYTIDCGTFDLGGNRWAVYFCPGVSTLFGMVTLGSIRLLTDSTKPLIVHIQINLIAKSGERVAVTATKHAVTYYRKNGVEAIPYIRKTKLDSSECVKDDCFSFECIVTVTKWSTAEVVKRKQQSTITS